MVEVRIKDWGPTVASQGLLAQVLAHPIGVASLPVVGRHVPIPEADVVEPGPPSPLKGGGGRWHGRRELGYAREVDFPRGGVLWGGWDDGRLRHRRSSVLRGAQVAAHVAPAMFCSAEFEG